VVRVDVRCEATGRTSYTLQFVVIRRDDDGADVAAARGRNVYVVVSTDDWAKRELPAGLRDGLTSVAGQGRNATDGGAGKGTVTP
jgi:acyl-CoA thioester hydrolase